MAEMVFITLLIHEEAPIWTNQRIINALGCGCMRPTGAITADMVFVVVTLFNTIRGRWSNKELLATMLGCKPSALSRRMLRYRPACNKTADDPEPEPNNALAIYPQPPTQQPGQHVDDNEVDYDMDNNSDDADDTEVGTEDDAQPEQHESY